MSFTDSAELIAVIILVGILQPLIDDELGQFIVVRKG
jgi:hypothetical protein